MRKTASALALVLTCGLWNGGTVLAIGSFDASNVTVTPALVQFDIANLDRTNDGDNGGYNGIVNYATIHCYDTGTTVAQTTNDTTMWNTGDTVAFTPTGYDGTPHTDCRARIYTNTSQNDYESAQSFSIPTQPGAATPNFDTTFDGDGKAFTPFGHNAYLASLAPQADGKVVAVGNIHNGSHYDWRIARYNVNGSLDTSFGTGGIVARDFGGHDHLDAVAVQSDGKIVVGGFSQPGPNLQWTIARYSPDGSVDTGFGSGGIVTTFPGQHSTVQDITLLPDGRLAVTGYVNTGAGDDVAIARYNPDGSLDTSFGTGGTTTTGISTHFTPNDRGKAIGVQSDGKIVVFGDYDAGFHDRVVLLRYNADGSLDGSFGSGGLITDTYQYHNGGSDIVVQPDGKIVVTGATSQGGGSQLDSYVARYNPDGSLDGSFSGGKVISAFSPAAHDGHFALALQPDGRVIAAGYQNNNGNDDSVVRRYNPDGSMDTSFGTNGSFVMPLSQEADILYAMLLQNGKIIVGGTATTNGTADWALARLTDGPAIQELTLTPNADTYVHTGPGNRNKGAAPSMKLQSGDNSRMLVRFDQSAIQSAIGNGTVLSAKLRLAITENGNNWGTGRSVALHRVLQDWAEGNGTESTNGTGPGATWACAVDNQISNMHKDCTGASQWEMSHHNPAVRPWAEQPTATQTITNNQSGIVEYDVTADVTNFTNGSQNNYGWLIKKVAQGGLNGSLSLSSKEGAAAAQLVITHQ